MCTAHLTKLDARKAKLPGQMQPAGQFVLSQSERDEGINAFCGGSDLLGGGYSKAAR